MKSCRMGSDSNIVIILQTSAFSSECLVFPDSKEPTKWVHRENRSIAVVVAGLPTTYANEPQELILQLKMPKGRGRWGS